MSAISAFGGHRRLELRLPTLWVFTAIDTIATNAGNTPMIIKLVDASIYMHSAAGRR
jgi:hypothetical protein